MQFDAQHLDYHRNYADADFLVVVIDGEPAGRMYVHRRAGEICLVDIALLAERRGNGTGTALVTELLDEARRTGRRLTLHVEPFNPALRLYLRLGFKPVEEQGVYLLMQWTPPGVGGVTG
jgi:GNAT superfamily N-acetyltransferase